MRFSKKGFNQLFEIFACLIHQEATRPKGNFIDYYTPMTELFLCLRYPVNDTPFLPYRLDVYGILKSVS